MKHLFWSWLIIVVIFPNVAFACDVCGSSLSGSSWGILPPFRKGLLNTKINYQQIRQLSTKTAQNFLSQDFSARFYPHQRWQLLVSGSFIHAQQKSYTLGDEKRFGLGDLQLMGSYLWVDNSRDSSTSRFKHSFLTSAGIKLPTGGFRQLSADGLINPYFQLGTGSWDFPFNAVYTCRGQKYGFSTELFYKINTENPTRFQFGNKMGAAQRFFLLRKLPRYSLMPQAGFLYEYNSVDNHRGQKMLPSGGQTLQILGNLDLYRKNFLFGVQVQIPIYQQNASGEVLRGAMYSLNMSYIF